MIFFLSELKLHSAVGEEWFFSSEVWFPAKGGKNHGGTVQKGITSMRSLSTFLSPRVFVTAKIGTQNFSDLFRACQRDREREREKS